MWQAFRAGKALVSPAEAAEIAAKNPDLCRVCLNQGDGPQAKAGIAGGIANGWPVPKDQAGWEAGSYGLGDILGSTAVWTGIEDAKTAPKTYSRALLPLIDLPAKTAMQRYDVQTWVIGVQIWQFLNGTPYKVLVPAKESANGDSYNTWGNIFSAYAAPAQYVQGQGQAAKARYLERAMELGIDLTEVAFPWPPGKSYKHGTAFAPVKNSGPRCRTTSAAT
ncbi:hypothetical protein [Nannocystis pusilla]|uniref:hypothetical protein n=1 Tax=Nannocystis pusilla TaxID=889268 RepID=UPI003B7A5EBE